MYKKLFAYKKYDMNKKFILFSSGLKYFINSINSKTVHRLCGEDLTSPLKWRGQNLQAEKKGKKPVESRNKDLPPLVFSSLNIAQAVFSSLNLKSSISVPENVS